MGAEPGLTRLQSGDDLGYEVQIDASPQIVWAHWTAPDLLVRWMGKVATLDPRPGGAYRLEYSNGDVAAGSFVDLDPPWSLTYTWGWEGEPDFLPGSTTIHVLFEAAAAGGTVMRLRHSGIQAAFRSNVDDGWDYFLPRLAEAAAGDGPSGTP